MKDIQKLLAQAVHLPLHSQKMLLKEIGSVYAKTGDGRCNLFAGPASCQPVPKDSDYASVCAHSNENVDCAFRMAAMEHVTRDPEKHFKEKLEEEGTVDISIYRVCKSRVMQEKLSKSGCHE